MNSFKPLLICATLTYVSAGCGPSCPPPNSQYGPVGGDGGCPVVQAITDLDLTQATGRLWYRYRLTRSLRPGCDQSCATIQFLPVNSTYYVNRDCCNAGGQVNCGAGVNGDDNLVGNGGSLIDLDGVVTVSYYLAGLSDFYIQYACRPTCGGGIIQLASISTSSPVVTPSVQVAISAVLAQTGINENNLNFVGQGCNCNYAPVV